MTESTPAPTRLYFTEEKICIGSYDEVARYEAETGKSYWASEFVVLPVGHSPGGYDPVGKTMEQILEDRSNAFRAKLALRGANG
jgi:hypothetical protein